MSDITDDVLIARIEVLIEAITGTGQFKGLPHDYRMGEFTMRIPAQPERDADLVLSEFVRRFKRLRDERDALFRIVKNYWEEGYIDLAECEEVLQFDEAAQQHEELL